MRRGPLKKAAVLTRKGVYSSSSKEIRELIYETWRGGRRWWKRTPRKKRLQKSIDTDSRVGSYLNLRGK